MKKKSNNDKITNAIQKLQKLAQKGLLHESLESDNLGPEWLRREDIDEVIIQAGLTGKSRHTGSIRQKMLNSGVLECKRLRARNSRGNVVVVAFYRLTDQ